MRPLTTLSTLALAAVASGCHVCCDWNPAIEGSGVLVAEERAVEDFDQVALAGGMQLYVRVGLPHRVVLHADDNLQQHIRTEIEGGELRIRFEESVDSDHTLRADIDLPTLRGVDIAGSSNLTIVGVEGPQLELEVAGSCRGEVSGWVDALEVDVAGSARLNLFELEAKNVSIDIAGSGRVQTHAIETLEVDVAGSADVTYRGQPRVDIRQAGSASVSPEG